MDGKDALLAFVNIFRNDGLPEESYDTLRDAHTLTSICGTILGANYFDAADLVSRDAAAESSLLQKSALTAFISQLETYLKQCLGYGADKSVLSTIDLDAALASEGATLPLVKLLELVVAACVLGNGSEVVSKVKKLPQAQQMKLRNTVKVQSAAWGLQKGAAAPAAAAARTAADVDGGAAAPAAGGAGGSGNGSPPDSTSLPNATGSSTTAGNVPTTTTTGGAGAAAAASAAVAGGDDGSADATSGGGGRPKLLQGSRFVEEDLRVAKADLEATRMKLEEERERHRAQATELESLKAEHDRLKDRYSKAVDEAARGSQVQLKELRDALDQRESAATDLTEQLKRVRAQLDTETANAAAAARDLREARDERDEATEQIAELKRRAATAESDAALATDKERAVTSRRNELEAQVVKLMDEAKQLTTTSDAQARELSDLKSASSDGTKEVAQLREKLRVATERATQAEADLATARAQAEAAAAEAAAAAAAHAVALAQVRSDAEAAASSAAANSSNAEAAAAAAAAAASAAATLDAMKADLDDAHRAIAAQEARATEAAAAAKTLETTVAGLKEQRAQDFAKIQEIVKNADAAKATVEAKAAELASDLDRVVAENAVLKTKLAAVVVSPIATDAIGGAGSPVLNAQISQLRDDKAQLQREYDAKMELVRKQHAALTSSLFDCGLRNLQLQVMSRRATWGGAAGATEVDDGEATAGAYADVGPGQPLTYLEWQRRNFTTGALDLLAKAARTSVGSR